MTSIRMITVFNLSHTYDIKSGAATSQLEPEPELNPIMTLVNSVCTSEAEEGDAILESSHQTQVEVVRLCVFEFRMNGDLPVQRPASLQLKVPCKAWFYGKQFLMHQSRTIRQRNLRRRLR